MQHAVPRLASRAPISAASAMLRNFEQLVVVTAGRGRLLAASGGWCDAPCAPTVTEMWFWAPAQYQSSAAAALTAAASNFHVVAAQRCSATLLLCWLCSECCSCSDDVATPAPASSALAMLLHAASTGCASIPLTPNVLMLRDSEFECCCLLLVLLHVCSYF